MLVLLPHSEGNLLLKAGLLCCPLLVGSEFMFYVCWSMLRYVILEYVTLRSRTLVVDLLKSEHEPFSMIFSFEMIVHSYMYL